MQADRKYLDLKESKNALETICYKYQEQFEGKMKPYLEESARQLVVKNMKETVEWLYEAGAESTFEEYTKRYEMFN